MVSKFALFRNYFFKQKYIISDIHSKLKNEQPKRGTHPCTTHVYHADNPIVTTKLIKPFKGEHFPSLETQIPKII